MSEGETGGGLQPGAPPARTAARPAREGSALRRALFALRGRTKYRRRSRVLFQLCPGQCCGARGTALRSARGIAVTALCVLLDAPCEKRCARPGQWPRSRTRCADLRRSWSLPACVRGVWARGCVWGGVRRGRRGALFVFVCVCVCVRAPRAASAAPSRLELIPDVAVL